MGVPKLPSPRGEALGPMAPASGCIILLIALVTTVLAIPTALQPAEDVVPEVELLLTSPPSPPTADCHDIFNVDQYEVIARGEGALTTEQRECACMSSEAQHCLHNEVARNCASYGCWQDDPGDPILASGNTNFDCLQCAPLDHCSSKFVLCPGQHY